MKVIRKSDGQWLIDGVQVDVLRKDVRPPAWKVQQYYELHSGKEYESMLNPCKFDRFVFLRQGTASYLIVPNRPDIYEFKD
jgi:hypothetical protein